jgi:hypothetical protein
LNGTNQYQLYVQIDRRWGWLCDITASSHSVAFQKAMLCLQPEHYDKPIRLEQVTDARPLDSDHP